jgi:hypothetical protein
MNPEQDKEEAEKASDQENKPSAEVRDLAPEKDPMGGRIKGTPQTLVNNSNDRPGSTY